MSIIDFVVETEYLFPIFNAIFLVFNASHTPPINLIKQRTIRFMPSDEKSEKYKKLEEEAKRYEKMGLLELDPSDIKGEKQLQTETLVKIMHILSSIEERIISIDETLQKIVK